MAKIAMVILIVFLVGSGYQIFEWTVNRIYVPVGYSMQLRYKGPPLPFLPGAMLSAEPGSFAKVNEKGNPVEVGILKEMVGPGRHFYNPFWWERELVADIVINPGEVAVATSKLGKSLPKGEFLVEGDLGKTEFKGIVRKVFGPGRYRVNPYAYNLKTVQTQIDQSGTQKKHSGWVEIETGYVGVVTNLASNPMTEAKKGIQQQVLQPGIYPINPREQQVDIVEIGYREKSITANLQKDARGEIVFDKSGEPMIVDDESGITFPSNDGFNIQMDFTAIWGIMPDQAPTIISKFGNVDAVESKVVIPQIESICRNQGSRLGAKELLIGESRQVFQEQTSLEFQKVLDEKDVTLLYGLVRHIYIPQSIRLPIQDSSLADEKKLTLEQQQITTKTEGDLVKAKQEVELEGDRVKAETEKLFEEALAEGDKIVAETEAETQKLVATIDRQIAEIEAEATVLLGEAEASSKQLLEEAKADKFVLAVDAFGSGAAYNQWVFATGLPVEIDLQTIYAGEGTFWTDLKGMTETLLGKQVNDKKSTSGSKSGR
ncbi:MAG: SPFH domain-containing protein [Planctomycetaceae bacterium]|nr:SPFH domain-containing protein [Planctomycetaceae bacterium]